MPEKQGSLALLDDPESQELLHSPTLAHLAYIATDGAPRVMPIWFAWENHQVIFCSISVAKKLNSIVEGSKVAVTIDGNSWPYHVLMIRGTVSISQFAGIVPGYKETAIRYIGEQNGPMFVGAIEGTGLGMKRIAVTPTWAGLLDFQTRWPGQT